MQFLSKVVLLDVDITRYNNLEKKLINGEISYSLQPNLYITIGDALSVLVYFFLFIGFEKSYKISKVKSIFINYIKDLDLLYIQLDATNIRFYADYLAYISSIESINLIYSKYRGNEKRIPNPDIPAIQSVICYFLSRVMLANRAFARYDELYKRYGNTLDYYLLQPSITINVANILGIISYNYLLYGVMGIYYRNINQPIVGI